MEWPVRCAAIIPCLNEEAAIGSLVREVGSYLPAILVVDDGSRDRTALLAAEAGAQVVRHETTRGKGAALQSGWQWAMKHGLLWALNLDGDGQHSPADIPAFLRCAEQHSAALVVGNRMAEVADMPPLRRFVNRWMSRRLSKAAGRSLPDSQCGFRLMNLQIWSALPIGSTHFEIESEVVLAFCAAGHRIEFVPIRTIYNGERSKIQPWRDTLRWFHWWASTRRPASR